MKTIWELSTPSLMLPVKRRRCAATLRLNDFFEAGLVDRHFARLELFDFPRIVVDADDVDGRHRRSTRR